MKDRVEIIAFTYPHEAHLARMLLEASGINVILKDELTIQVDNFLSNAIGGVKIFVEKDKKEEALLLLESNGYIEKEHPERQKKIEVFSSEYISQCPYCESVNIKKKETAGYIFVFSILLLSFPFPFLRKRYYCYDCLKEWKIRK